MIIVSRIHVTGEGIVDEYEINIENFSVSHLYSCMDGGTFH